MNNVNFNHKEIQDLARKVGTLQPFFTEKEHALLLSIFAAAAEHIHVQGLDHGVLPGTEIASQKPEPPGGARPTLTDLQRQLLNAYYPGSVSGGIAAKITGIPPAEFKITGTPPIKK